MNQDRAVAEAREQRTEDAEMILKRIDWQVVRRLDGLLQGDYRSVFTGHGYDLAEVREYEPSDDVRYMDWNVTARMDQPYIRQYVEEREITAWLLLDRSPSVDFGTARARKLDVVIDFAAVLARLLMKHGNQVGAMLFSGGVDEVIPPKGGQLQTLRLIHQLVRQDRKAEQGTTNLAQVLNRAAETLKRRSLVFVVSDFIGGEGWEAPLARLAQRHEVIAVWLQDPREDELPEIGNLVLEDAETGEQVFVDTNDKGFQERFRWLVEGRKQEMTQLFNRHAIDVLKLTTEGDMVESIVRFAHLRRESRRRPSGRAMAVHS